MLIQGRLFGEQLTVLAQRGFGALAASVNDHALSQGRLDVSAHAALKARLAGFPSGTIGRGYELYGVFMDSVVSSLHFAPVKDRALAQEAFRQAVRWIEIETSSQCNRRCSYCPNSRFDRLRHNDFLDKGIFEKMARNLSEIDYDGDIKFVGNNEFFMHPENRAYVEYARQWLPKAKFTLFSNGDYLTRDDLEWASSVGVNVLIVTLHPGPTKRFNDTEVLRRAHLFQSQVKLPLQLRHFESGKNLHFTTTCGNTRIIVGLTDLDESGHNWTGLLPGDETYVRSDPCTYPLRQFVVNYRGDIFMCCIAFKDRTPENTASGAITGNLADYETVFQAYTSPGLVAWRRSMFTTLVKDAPCRTCRGHSDYREAESHELADFVSRELNAPADAAE